MKAVAIHEHGGIDRLSYEDVPVPKISPNEILVEVKAVALNHLDLWVRQGLPSLKLTMPHILGSDIAGVVSKIGSVVTNIRMGDPVLLAPGFGCGTCEFCLSGDDNLCRDYKILGENITGGYAEFVKAPAGNAFAIPDGLGFKEAAAIPLVFLTAWHMLVEQAKVKPGDDVLILAAGSGVGSAAVQIAKLYGARVFATASTKEKLRKSRELGADETINYAERDFLDEVRRLTHRRGVDVVFEHIGEKTWDKSIKALAKGGRLVTCGATTGYNAVTDLRYLFSKDLKICGNFMGRKASLKHLLRFFPEKLRPVLDTTFPLKDAAEAHRRLIDRKQFGKIVLIP